MRIVVDSREQSPLDFPFKQVTAIVTQKLDVGDYACQFDDGTIAPLFFERKSKGDLWNTLTGQTKIKDSKGKVIKKINHHERFRKELQRAIDNKYTIILIVECSLIAVIRGYNYKVREGGERVSKMSGSAIAKTMFTLWIKYGVFPVFCKDREEMSNYIYGTFCALEKIHNKRLK